MYVHFLLREDSSQLVKDYYNSIGFFMSHIHWSHSTEFLSRHKSPDETRNYMKHLREQAGKLTEEQKEKILQTARGQIYA